MEIRLELDIARQPNNFTCGPTCLHAVYRYYGDEIELPRIIEEVQTVEGGGTLAVVLACHALRRGYRATIYTYNLQMFDPTWFVRPNIDLRDRLRLQNSLKDNHRLKVATEAYIEFLDRGGVLGFEDLTSNLLRRFLNRSVPFLTGLSATYLYRCMREFGPKDDDDDVRGTPQGHFVVVCGYHRADRTVLVADPLFPNPGFSTQKYEVNIDRLICSILLGIVTYDANLLIIEPPRGRKGS